MVVEPWNADRSAVVVGDYFVYEYVGGGEQDGKEPDSQNDESDIVFSQSRSQGRKDHTMSLVTDRQVRSYRSRWNKNKD